MRIIIAIAVTLALCPACAGSGASHPSGAAGGACAFVAHYHGRTYGALGVHTAPTPGQALGYAILPPCDDNEQAAPPAPERIPVAEVPGTPPSEALVWIGHPDTIIVRDPSHPPKQVARYLRKPA